MEECLCCGYKTIEARWNYEICPVCFWEDEFYITPVKKDGKYELIAVIDNIESFNVADILTVPSGANHGLTLQQARENFKLFGACQENMIPHVRKPLVSELKSNEDNIQRR